MARFNDILRVFLCAALTKLMGGLRLLGRGCSSIFPSKVPRRRALSVVLLLLIGWLSWLGFNRSGVRAGLENVAREAIAFHRIRKFREELLFAGQESGVDPNLLAGILWTESSGRLDAVSSAGAMGLFQLKPITFEWRAEVMGLPIPTSDQILSDALLNARIGANNIAWLLDTYDGNVERALVAYNAGPGKLAELENKAGGWVRLNSQMRAAGDSQLLSYVDKVLRTAAAVREQGILGENPSVPRPIPKPPGNR